MNYYNFGSQGITGFLPNKTAAFMCARLRLFLSFFFLVVIITSCSTQKNTLLTRTYHQVTSRYNLFFNGSESFRVGVRRSEQQFVYDYNQILPVFLYTDPDIARSVTPEMDRAIDKASRVIANKSITARPNRGSGLFSGRGENFHRQNEYNRWVRESYLLVGKAHFYKHDFGSAAQVFLFIIREYNMNSIRHEAKVWLARTYSERGRFNEARLIFDEILGDPDFPPGLNEELYSTIADYHLKQDQLENAIVYMEEALEAAGKKELRIRYTYILAQLHEHTGDYRRASDYYARVARMNPPYEMGFNARINQAGVYQAGRGEVSRIINDLERMLRDEKNRDYQDQIHYAIGNIYLRENDESNAIRHFSLSAGTSGTNPSQKTLTYLALADIYFAHSDYLKSQAYYDSAVINMHQGFPNQQAIIERTGVLTDLVENIRLYELEDSVQILASMSEAERNRIIDNIIAQVIQEEAEAAQHNRLAQQAPMYRSAQASQSARFQADRAGGGNWYFYNPSAVTFGQNEFESIWGGRRLEDNWRRSNRQIISGDQFVAMDNEDVSGGEIENEITDTRSREYYMRNIPLTDQAMQASVNRLQQALFNMGVIYKDYLLDYERSSEAYEEIIMRYPDGDFSLPAMYDLHNLYLEVQDFQTAQYFKDKIVTGYPGSAYASMLTNPDFLREYEEQLQETERYYEETFILFRDNKFDQVIDRAVFALSKWPESYLIPRFEYLKTLSYGSRGNIAVFRDMLSGYIGTYPETEMAEDARQFIFYLDNDYSETVYHSTLDVIKDMYEPEQKGEHYFVMIMVNRQDLVNRLIFNIVNFNVDNFARLNLNINSEAYSTNYQLIRVEGLPDIPIALDYLRRFSVSDEVFFRY